MTESEKLIGFLERMKNLVTARILEEQELEMIIKALEEIQQYRAIGTIERFRELTEKAEPKKPIIDSQRFVEGCKVKTEFYHVCPNCEEKVTEEMNFCNKCGQRLKRKRKEQK